MEKINWPIYALGFSKFRLRNHCETKMQSLRLVCGSLYDDFVTLNSPMILLVMYVCTRVVCVRVCIYMCICEFDHKCMWHPALTRHSCTM